MINGLSIKTNKQGKQNIYISPKLNAKDGEVVIYYLEELKDLENADVTNSPEYIKLQDKCTDFENKYNELSLKNEEVTKYNQDISLRIGELNKEVDDYVNSYEDMITEVKEFQKVKQDLLVKLETSKNKIKQQEEIHKLELDIKNNTIANLNEKVTNLNDTLEDVTIKSNAKDKSINDLDIQVKELKFNLNSKEEQILLGNETLKNKDKSINDLNKKINELNDIVKDLTANSNAKDKEIKELEIRIKELDFNIHSQEEKIAKTNEKLNNKDNQIKELNKVIEDITANSNSKNIKIKELELQEEQVKVLSEKLTKAENKLEDLNQVKVVMGGLVGYIKNIKWYNLLFSKSSLNQELSKVDKLLNAPEDKSIDTYAVVKKGD